jgi:hypothetical protein
MRTNTCPVFLAAEAEPFENVEDLAVGLRTQTCPL